MTTMPRILSDVSRIEEVLKNIETEMQSLATQLRTFDLRNVAGVEDLSRLDNLKNNMEQVGADLRTVRQSHANASKQIPIRSGTLYYSVQGNLGRACKVESGRARSQKLFGERWSTLGFCRQVSCKSSNLHFH